MAALAVDDTALEAAAEVDAAADEAVAEDAAFEAEALVAEADAALADALLALDEVAEEQPTAATSASAHTDATTSDFRTGVDLMTKPLSFVDDRMVPRSPSNPLSHLMQRGTTV